MDINSLKKQISNFPVQKTPAMDDAILKGGYRVVRTIKERDSIDCCYRKLGMRVMVIGQDYSFKDYILKGDNLCSNEGWVLASIDPTTPIDTVEDSDVILLDDYSDLDVTQNIETQQDLNRVLATVLKTILLSQTIGDKNFIYEQALPSNTWSILHNLNKKPSVTIIDSANSIIEGAISYDSNSQLTITFNFPFSGKAILN